MWQGALSVACNQALKPMINHRAKQAVGRVLEMNQQTNDFMVLTQLPRCLFMHSRKSNSFQINHAMFVHGGNIH